jgi:glycosyltransferase involved in cell wall biosynthesis
MPDFTLRPPSAPQPGILFEGPLKLWENKGESMHLREVATCLAQRGYRSYVLCLPSPSPAPASTIHELAVPIPRLRGLLQLLWNIRATIAGVKAVRRHQLSLVYARLNPGMIASVLIARLTGRPLVLEINGLLTEDMRRQRGDGLQTRMVRWWERRMYPQARMVVAAPGYARYYEKHFGVPKEKFCVVPLGVDLQLFSPAPKRSTRAKLSLPDAPTVVWMGNFAWWQGLPTLVKAMPLIVRRLPAVRFLLVGDGPERPAVEAAMREDGMENHCIFTGRKPHGAIPDYLSAADVCVGTFPLGRGDRGSISALKTISYLATGRPVVTSDMDDLGETIQACGAGRCFPADDHQALAEAITAILSEPSSRWEQRCAAARTLAEDMGGWEGAAKRIDDGIARHFPEIRPPAAAPACEAHS